MAIPDLAFWICLLSLKNPLFGPCHGSALPIAYLLLRIAFCLRRVLFLRESVVFASVEAVAIFIVELACSIASNLFWVLRNLAVAALNS